MRVMFGPRRTLPPPRIAVDVGQFVETPASLIGYIPLSPIKKSDYQLDIQGIEPWTSRMRSVRATTVPNARHGSILLPDVERWLHSIEESNITSRVRTLPLSRATSRQAAFEIGL